MEKDTNEKSLMVVQDNFLTKIKKFFVRFFYGKDDEFEYDNAQNDENKKSSDEVEKNEEQEPERKLYDFDADNPEEWPEPKEIISDSDDEDYEKESVSEVCREKEELEQKLKNYYASITKMNN